MKFGSVVSCAAALVCAAGLGQAASAATVDTIVGSVLVNKGKGFRPVTSPTEIATGDSVMVQSSSGADILYPNGCRIHVNPGAIATVFAKRGGLGNPSGLSSCQEYGYENTGATNGTGAITTLDPGLPGPGGIDPVTVVIGGAVVGGAVVGIIALSDDGASP
jgi:hypothetical protein